VIPAGTRVLVVEDEALIAVLVEDYLTDLGCEIVGIAARLEDGLAKAASLQIDVAILDMNLAG
jgi:DNA-binding response OmpR family regulator